MDSVANEGYGLETRNKRGLKIFSVLIKVFETRKNILCFKNKLFIAGWEKRNYYNGYTSESLGLRKKFSNYWGGLILRKGQTKIGLISRVDKTMNNFYMWVQ